MNKRFKNSILFFFFCTPFLMAQTKDFGSIGTVTISKDFGRYWGMKLEQEFRLNQNSTTFDRSLTSIGLDYALFRKRLKAGLDYDFIQQRNNQHFEIKHRSSFFLTTGLKLYSFDFEWRTKGQSTWRDETRGDYKFNPRYVWRNKLECGYTIFGSPVKPFISGEIFCPINGINGFFMDSYRSILGLNYRYSKHSSVELLLRFDQEIQQANAKSMVYGGVGWRYRL